MADGDATCWGRFAGDSRRRFALAPAGRVASTDCKGLAMSRNRRQPHRTVIHSRKGGRLRWCAALLWTG